MRHVFKIRDKHRYGRSHRDLNGVESRQVMSRPNDPIARTGDDHLAQLENGIVSVANCRSAERAGTAASCKSRSTTSRRSSSSCRLVWWDFILCDCSKLCQLIGTSLDKERIASKDTL
jgi:hypothetical protein